MESADFVDCADGQTAGRQSPSVKSADFLRPFFLRRGHLLLLLLLGLGAGWAQEAKVQSALELLQKGRVEEAIQLLEKGLGRDPQNEPMNAMRGQIAFQQQDYDKAAAHFEKAPAVLANNPLLSVNYAEALLRTRNEARAKQVLAGVPKTDAVAQFESGLLLARFGQLLAAEKYFQRAQKGYPKPAVAAYNLALAQYQARKLPECIATLEEAERKYPKHGNILTLLGKAYLEANQAENALKTLKQAIRNDPQDEGNYILIAGLAVDEDMISVGMELLDQGIEHLPKSYPLHILRGYLRLPHGRYADAELDYRKAMKIQPKSASAKIGLAYLYLHRERHEDAIALLQQVTQAHPSNFFAYYLMGELRIREGREEEAMKHLKRAAALQPAYSRTRTSLGKLYLKKKDPRSAIPEFEAAIKLDPDDITAYYQVSIAYRKTGQKEEAREALAQVKRLNKEKRALGNASYLNQRLRRMQMPPLSEQ